MHGDPQELWVAWFESSNRPTLRVPANSFDTKSDPRGSDPLVRQGSNLEYPVPTGAASLIHTIILLRKHDRGNAFKLDD